MSRSAPFTRIAVSAGEGSGVVTIRLAYPERRNAIGPRMANELLHALDEAKTGGARVVVLAAEGKVFCAGGDFGDMTSPGAAEGDLPPMGDYADLLLALARSEVPIVCKVQGHAMGGGLGIVAASTLAIAAEGAQLGTPEVDVGLFPMMIMAILKRTVPEKRLLHMMLTGERIEAAEAKALGIVNDVVPAEALDARVDALVAKLAKASPITLKLGLRAHRDHDGMRLEEAIPMLRGRLAEVLATDDAREGLTAFLEKRAPVWTGK